MKKVFITEDVHEGKRLDKVVAENIGNLSRSEGKRLIQDGQITVNKNQVKPSYILRIGEIIRVELPQREEVTEPQDIPIEILYEDKDIIAVNKEAKTVVHPAPGNPEGTLVNGLLYKYPGIRGVGQANRPGIVHRLDKDTSGVMVIARSQKAYLNLVEQFKNREVSKIYWGLVHGIFDEDEGIIDMPIGRDRRHRKMMAVTKKYGKEAITRFRMRSQYERTTLVEIYPKTGRTNQIRVHFSYIGHPIIGDGKYGRRHQIDRACRTMLHAKSLRLNHPISQGKMEFNAPLREDFKKVQKILSGE